MAHRFANRRILGIFLTLSVALVALVASGAWYAFREQELPLSAQQAVQDICASATNPDHYDFTWTITQTYGDLVINRVVDFRRAPNGEHYVVTDGDGNTVGEVLTLIGPVSSSVPLSYNSRLEGTARSTKLSRVEDSYQSNRNEEGILGDWVHTSRTLTDGEAAMISDSTRRELPHDSPMSFCGLLLEDDDHDIVFRFEGTETVNGVSTRHYYHKISRLASAGGVGDSLTTEFWIDSDGRLRKSTVVSIVPGGGGDSDAITSQQTIYSGFGEANVFQIPAGLPSPSPTPLSTATLTPTATTANPCTRVTEHYDVEGRTYAGNDLVGRYLAEVSPVAVLTTFQDNNGRAQAQRLWVGDTWDTVRSESRSVVLSRFTPSGIEYDRAKTSDGSWGPWDSERKSLEGESGASGFCGYSNDHITNVDQGGTERVLGVSATKYTVDYYADGTSILMNFWVDSSGSLIRKILT